MKYTFKITYVENETVELVTIHEASFDRAFLRLRAYIMKKEKTDWVKTVELLEDGRTLLIYNGLTSDGNDGWKPVWRNLYSGHVTVEEVRTAIQDSEWQCLRESLKGTSLVWKYVVLRDYLLEHPDERARQVRVTNYVTALSRGGLIKPEDYR